MKTSRVELLILWLAALFLTGCDAKNATPVAAAKKLTLATIESRPVTLTQEYVGQIRSHHRIEVRSPVPGYISAVPIHEGQDVKRGELLFQIRPLADNKRLVAENGPGIPVVAAFDGIVDRLPHQEGSLVQRGDPLTTLSDNAEMWVYFNVPEARYLEYKADGIDQHLEKHSEDFKIELLLASGEKFDQPGKLGAIQGNFNRETGQISFRADFPNPDRLLRHGQAGTVLISRKPTPCIVVPQKATFEVLGKRYVYLVGKDNVARQRAITVQTEINEDLVVKAGVSAGDKIVLDDVRKVNDGDRLQVE
jgi:membrane fusion protein (multidrug efflux system)